MSCGSLVSPLTIKMKEECDIIYQTVIFDNYVEGSLPKGSANRMGLAVLTRLVAPRPNLGG